MNVKKPTNPNNNTMYNIVLFMSFMRICKEIVMKMFMMTLSGRIVGGFYSCLINCIILIITPVCGADAHKILTLV